MLIACPTDNVPFSGAEGEITRATVKTKLGTVKASFKATSIYESSFVEVGTCKYTYTRRDTTDPNVAPCAN